MNQAARRGVAALILTSLPFAAAISQSWAEQEPMVHSSLEETNSFPDPNDILKGHLFRTSFERDVFFLREIRQGYPQFWSSLLNENIALKDYVQSPEKLLRFAQELAVVVEGTDDLAAITNLTRITSEPEFYANTNAYHPEILTAAAAALIRTGPKARKALSHAFNEDHYRADPVSLSLLADTIRKAGISDSNLNAALATTAFVLTATNGGSYPTCTRDATFNLLSLPNGASVIAPYLNRTQLFRDPGRFQAIVDGVAAARAVSLASNLTEIGVIVEEKLRTLPPKPDPYREDLLDLQARIKKALELLSETGKVPSN